MHIRVFALAGLLVYLQAHGADPASTPIKPAGIGAASASGKIGGIGAVSASGKIESATTVAETSTTLKAGTTTLKAATTTLKATTTTTLKSTTTTTKTAATTSTAARGTTTTLKTTTTTTTKDGKPASAAAAASAASAASMSPLAAKIHESVMQLPQTSPSPKPRALTAYGSDYEANVQKLAIKVAERMAEVRKRQDERERLARLHPPVPKPKPVVYGSHWDYEGASGPSNWGKLNPDWAKCGSGERQSPIDIRDGLHLDLEKIQFDYHPSAFSVLDNGHTVQVSVAGDNRLTITGRSYELTQFHFHRPSEERVDGRGFAMVAHLVHKNLAGRLAVVAVLIEEGNPHKLVQTVWNNLPLEKNEAVQPVATTIDLTQLLPQRRDYYTYMGSLTTPPCSEDVLWLVMKEPITLSSQQIAVFSRLYPMNARPIQAASGRLIKESN